MPGPRRSGSRYSILVRSLAILEAVVTVTAASILILGFAGAVAAMLVRLGRLRACLCHREDHDRITARS